MGIRNTNKKIQTHENHAEVAALAAPEASRQKADGTVEVLYQKMGDRWFAFSLVGDDVFVGSIAPEEIEAWEIREPGKKDPTPTA